MFSFYQHICTHYLCWGRAAYRAVYGVSKEIAVLQQPLVCAAAGESQREESHGLFTSTLLNLQEKGAGGHM